MLQMSITIHFHNSVLIEYFLFNFENGSCDSKIKIKTHQKLLQSSVIYLVSMNIWKNEISKKNLKKIK